MESFNSSSYGSSQPTIQNNRGEQEFQRLCQTIGTSIQKINQNVSSMQKMVKQFGSHQDSHDLRQQFNSLQQYTRKLVVDTNAYIKEVSTFPASALQSEQRQRKMQRARLQDEYTMALSAFQGAQRSAAARERDLFKEARAQSHIDPFAGPKKETQLIELQDNTASRQQQQQQQLQQQLQEEADLRNLQEQEEAIRQLEKDIVDVNQIFKELGSLVHEQGEVLDSIEASVESTANYVQQGGQELRAAATYKNKVTKKKIYLALIAAIILTIIIVIIVTSLK